MLDMDRSHNKVVRVLSTDTTLLDGMNELIDFCAARESWRGYGPRYASSTTPQIKPRLKRWLKRVLTNERPPRSINQPIGLACSIRSSRVKRHTACTSPVLLGPALELERGRPSGGRKIRIGLDPLFRFQYRHQ